MRPAPGADCNRNGLLDSLEIEHGTEADCDRDGVPDVCESYPARFGFPGPLNLPIRRLSTDAVVSNLILSDLDGDSDLDIAAGNFMTSDLPGLAGRITIIPGQGDGSFASAREIDLSARLGFIAAADLDADGDSDLAYTTIEDDKRLGWFSNGGEASFSQGPELLLGRSFYIGGLAAADLNRDGDLDLVTLSTVNGSSGISSFMNEGRGHFSDPLDFPIEDFLISYYPEALAIADLDGDAFPDVAATAQTHPGVILLFNRAGRFADPRRIPQGGRIGSVAAGDLDGDGDVDLGLTAFGDASNFGEVVFQQNEGGGFFTARITIEVPRDAGSLHIADLDRDGDPDFALAGSNLAFIANLGGADYQQAVDYTVPWASFVVRSGDLDGDGLTDLVAGVSQGVAVIFGRGKGEFSAAKVLDPGFRPLFLAAADLDGDGDTDLATMNVISAPGDREPPALTVFSNRGQGEFTIENVVDFHFESWGAEDILARDLDGDRFPELIVTAEKVSILRKEGDRGWIQAADLRPGVPRLLTALGDIDGDGGPDLIERENPNGVSGFLNQGGLRFSRRPLFQKDDVPLLLAAGDFDSSGREDVLSVTRQEISVHRDPLEVGAPAVGRIGLTIEPIALVTGDLNGDGKLDVVLANPPPGDVELGPAPAGNVSVFLNARDGEFAMARNYSAGLSPLTLVAADLDRDGDLDLVTGDGRKSMGMLLNHGDGAFLLPAAIGLLGSGTWRLVASDLDADGDQDLVSVGLLGLSVGWNETGEATMLDRDGNHLPDVCERKPFHRGDPNGDGVADLTDAIEILLVLFQGRAALACQESGDVNGDGQVDLSDAIGLLWYLFLSGPPPAEPGPPGQPCGLDPDPPGSPLDLGCSEYARC